MPVNQTLALLQGILFPQRNSSLFESDTQKSLVCNSIDCRQVCFLSTLNNLHTET